MAQFRAKLQLSAVQQTNTCRLQVCDKSRESHNIKLQLYCIACFVPEEQVNTRRDNDTVVPFADGMDRHCNYLGSRIHIAMKYSTIYVLKSPPRGMLALLDCSFCIKWPMTEETMEIFNQVHYNLYRRQLSTSCQVSTVLNKKNTFSSCLRMSRRTISATLLPCSILTRTKSQQKIFGLLVRLKLSCHSVTPSQFQLK